MLKGNYMGLEVDQQQGQSWAQASMKSLKLRQTGIKCSLMSSCAL